MALLFTVLLSAAVMILGYFIYDFGRAEYQRESGAAIDAEIENLLLELELDQGHTLAEIVSRRAAARDQVFYLLTDLSGNRKAGDLKRVPESVDRITEGLIRFEIEVLQDAKPLSRQVAARIHTFDNGDQLMVARDISDIVSRFRRQRLLSLLSIVCMILVILVSYLISGFVVSRINRISNTALEIMETGDLSRRLPVDSRWDDLSHLSRVLNEMLARIEALMEGVKQVSDNIAHDLRTPLTRLRNRLEGLQALDLPAEQVEALIAEADGILETFRSLLRISQLDAGGSRANFSRVDLGQITSDAIDLYQPIAEDQGIVMHFTGRGCFIPGDRNLLFQAVSNLLDNAVKYSGVDNTVSCKVEVRSSFVEVVISDQGPGVSDPDKSRILDRFYRCDHSRTTRGTGLGLSLVAAIVRLHDGQLVFEDVEPSGLRVRMRIPLGKPKITPS